MNMQKYPEAAKIILDMTYMDDMGVTASDKVKATQLTQDVLAILESGGFYGHKISASDPDIVRS